MLKKNYIILLLCFILLVATVFLLYASVIFQEGSPLPQIAGIIKLNFSGKKIVKLSGYENRYMTKNKDGQEVVKDFMTQNNYNFVEQMGSGYFFKSTNSNAIVVRRQYSSFYLIWDITENKNVNLKEELKGCMPKSDTASYEKCNELIKQITDFDSCVATGFSIMKSNPPQCATPDGRIFFDKINK